MGEMADYIIDADDCEGCGIPFDEPGDGYPRRCAACRPSRDQRPPSTPVRHCAAGARPRPPGQQQVQNPPYPSKTARNRAKKARRRARATAAEQGAQTNG